MAERGNSRGRVDEAESIEGYTEPMHMLQVSGGGRDPPVVSQKGFLMFIGLFAFAFF